MMIYKTIYSFEAFKKINEGKQVYVLDRQNKSVALLNEMDAKSAVNIVNSTKGNRFEFWYTEESEESEE